jgi:Domain of unknown function (DUF4387)
MLSHDDRGSQELTMARDQVTLESLAKVIRSKNAGPFELTFDILFDDAASYERVKKSGAINAHVIAEIYRVRVDDVLVCRPYDPAAAFKVTIRRPVGSGDVTDRDVYGCQQHVPLMKIEI